MMITMTASTLRRDRDDTAIMYHSGRKKKQYLPCVWVLYVKDILQNYIAKYATYCNTIPLS